MKANEDKLIPCVCLILKKDNKILLLKRKNTGWCDGQYSLVGGSSDGNETMTYAVIREAKEELGIEIDKKCLKVVHAVLTSGHENQRVVSFIFEATSWKGEPKNMEPEKHENFEWFELNNFPENIIPCDKLIIQKAYENIFYSEFGLE